MNESAALPDPATTPGQTRAAAAEARVDLFLAQTEHTADHLFRTLTFLLFVVYALLGVVGFWLWVVSALLLVLRVVLKLVMTPLLWIADGVPRTVRGTRQNVFLGIRDAWRWHWAERDRFYRSLALDLAVIGTDATHGAIRFWYLTISRKVFVLILGFFFVFLPGTYLVPRPVYVQVTDDNAIQYGSDGTRVQYLIHAVDLFDETETHEFLNEQAPWFLKFDIQGLKNRIVPGRYYKFWVVGIRWNFPQLFPNIIGATEVDRGGDALEHPSHFVPDQTAINR